MEEAIYRKFLSNFLLFLTQLKILTVKVTPKLTQTFIALTSVVGQSKRSKGGNQPKVGGGTKLCS